MKKLFTLLMLFVAIVTGAKAASGDVLFSQSFDATGAGSVAYTVNTARAYTTASGKDLAGIVGTGDNLFTSITCNAKDKAGIGINNSTGGNSKDYTGKFGAYYDNTSGYWSICKTTPFSTTAPTAIKIEMTIAFSPVSSGSNTGVQFAVGSGFADGLTNSCPGLNACVAGFSLPSNNNIRVSKYVTSNGITNINGNSKTITAGAPTKLTWVINNTDKTLNYTGEDNNPATLAAGCWDLWVGTEKNLSGVTKTTTGMSGTKLDNLYIGSPFGKKHELILNDLIVTDLTPASGPVDPLFSLSKTTIGTDETAQIKVGSETGLDGITLSDISYGTAGVVSVNATTGEVTPVAAGSTTITFNSSAVAGKYNASSGNLSITVTVPKCATPTIATGDFNFEHKGYKVTITNNEDGSTLKVSTDGSSYTTQTSPYETYATTTTHYYAKAEKTSYEDSDVADKNVTNTFDGEKKFVAWVYTKGYGAAEYTFADDPMVTALQSIYNVVEINGGTSAPSADLANADLIVCTEAMQGNNALSNGMKTFAGNTPMIGLKAFNYTKGRWNWGTPANPSSTTLSFNTKATNYKLLEGVTFESDGTIKLATQSYNSGNQKNVVQTVNFEDSEEQTVAPANLNILGNLDANDNKAVLFTSTKYVGLGLSSDCSKWYTESTIAIVKNAAAMLIAGEDLNATSSEDLHQKVAISTTSGNTYATYVTNNNLNFTGIEGITAYIATGDNGSTITTQAVTEVPAGTALLVKTAEAGATVNVPVITSTPATLTANKLKFSNESLVITSEQATAKRYYGFFKVNNKYGFAPMAAGTLAAKKAYLDYGVDGNSLQFIALDLEDAPTAINFVEAENNANSAAPIKVIKNGKLYIGNYNVAGQLVK